MSSNYVSDLQFSHIGLYVTDLPRMVQFYKQALRFIQTDAGKVGPVEVVFLSRDPKEHHQIVMATGRPADLAFNTVNQMSFRVPDLPTLRRYHQRLVDAGATNIEPTAHGNSISIYCRDLEGYKLEIFVDTPWYCDQPLRELIDFNQSDEAIMAYSETLAKRFPNFQPVEQWQAEMARRMQAAQRDD